MKDLTGKGLMEHYTGLAMQALVGKTHLSTLPQEAVDIAAGVVKALEDHYYSEEVDDDCGEALNAAPKAGVKVRVPTERITDRDDLFRGMVLFVKTKTGEFRKSRVEFLNWRVGRIGRAVVSYARGVDIVHAPVKESSLYRADWVERTDCGFPVRSATLDDVALGAVYLTFNVNEDGKPRWEEVRVVEVSTGYKDDPWLRIRVAPAGSEEERAVSLEDLFILDA